MKRVIPFLTVIGLLVFALLSTSLGSRLLYVEQSTENDQFSRQNNASVDIFKWVAPGPTGWNVRTPGLGDNPGIQKLVELEEYLLFAPEVMLLRRVCLAIFRSLMIIPSVNERTLVFPFHSFW